MDEQETESSPILRKGDTGEAVTQLQTLLNAQGSSLAVDGIFQATTLASVISFQQRHGLPVNGIVGPETWQLLQHPKNVEA
ncbi:peptidoglycan-binding domain-containing protein [Thermocoleostomius sinensis]|jgi:peptidoglycan hydrolase-like protein with peptidoglycan-binding domain|uniref:Peptidoglycan-binding domain-containing protein n=1 Tax=Thermocoleostomius sinensis A174 TaxID=2016057 RepID=A0A9E8ZMW1_9CYAN|nr:peptidoglycan-binding domain-containing protein [Thermocoleostomius sinensis]WAL61436.1 peptidoglycan-binding domain-containing protein [Thermocoleostomius sinensis A174]